MCVCVNVPHWFTQSLLLQRLLCRCPTCKSPSLLSSLSLLASSLLLFSMLFQPSLPPSFLPPLPSPFTCVSSHVDPEFLVRYLGQEHLQTVCFQKYLFSFSFFFFRPALNSPERTSWCGGLVVRLDRSGETHVLTLLSQAAGTSSAG